MAIDVAEPSGSTRSHSTHRGVLDSVHHFFNSKLGLAVLTFFLTSGIGAVASWIVADFEQARQADTLSLQARATEISSLHTGIIRSIIEREIAADYLMNAFQVGTSTDEVSALWKNYEDAVHSESQQELQSHLAITFHTQDGPDPVADDSPNYFWFYLTAAIQPRFDAMHDCLLATHNSFISATGPLPDRFKKAGADVAGCRKDADWDRLAYVEPASGNPKIRPMKHSISDWDDFKTCLEDYTFFLDESARLEARAGQSQRSWNLFRFAGQRQDCREDNTSCQLHTLFSQLKTGLAQSCGNFDKGLQ